MKRLVIGLGILLVILGLGCEIEKSLELVPSTGILCLEVVPASAEVYLDGKYLGKANQFTRAQGCLKLEVGPHHLVITKPGFDTYERDIYIGAGEQEVSVRLGKEKPAPASKHKPKKK